MDKKQKLAEAYGKCSRYFYAKGNMRLAIKYWNKIYNLHLSPMDLFSVMSKFTDQQVYNITDAIRDRYYRAVGIL